MFPAGWTAVFTARCRPWPAVNAGNCASGRIGNRTVQAGAVHLGSAEAGKQEQGNKSNRNVLATNRAIAPGELNFFLYAMHGSPSKETRDTRASRRVPFHAAARCRHRNFNLDIRVESVGNARPVFRLQRWAPAGLSNVAVSAKLNQAQRLSGVMTNPESCFEQNA